MSDKQDKNKGGIHIICKKFSANAEDITWNTTGNFSATSGKNVQVFGKEGVEKKDYNEVKRKQHNVETTKVKEIERLTSLDKGSSNDETNSYQEGLIFGKIYTFKVKSYTKSTPKDKNQIKWAIRYHSPIYAQNKWIDIEFSARGEQISIHMNNKDMCGRFVTIIAYIEDKKSEGNLKLWKHNRFRFFDRQNFDTQLLAIKNAPHKINQSATSLCGVAAIIYFYAKDNKQEFYEKYCEFFRTGSIEINDYLLSPNSTLYDMEPIESNEKYPHYAKYSNGKPCIPHILMPQTDWIILAGTRSGDNENYRGEQGEDWDAINWPSYMSKIAKGIYGANQVVDNTRVVTGFNFAKTLIMIQKEYQEGWNIVMLIDSDMLDDTVSWAGCMTQYHWISYKGDMSIDEIQGKYTFSYVCWGEEYNIKEFRASVFNSNFYGYIKFKK